MISKILLFVSTLTNILLVNSFVYYNTCPLYKNLNMRFSGDISRRNILELIPSTIAPVIIHPKYVFAYKDILEDQIGETTVEYIEWNISKDGYIIPTIILKPITIGGVIIKRTTGFNAKFIIDNNLGPGAEVEIIRSGDVIPYIKTILKCATSNKPQLPKLKWHWTPSHIDIQLDDIHTNIEVHIKNLYHFFSTLKIKGLREKTLRKIYESGLTTVEKILTATKKQLLNIANFGEKSADNLLHEFKQKLDNISLPILMAASNKLGHGLGEERMKQIIQYYPNILFDYKKWDQTVFINNIKKISGWNDKTATLFVTNFPEFIYFYNIIKKYIKLKSTDIIQTGKFTNKIIIFSGFRDKDLEIRLEKQGAKIVTTMSKNINYLIIKHKNLLDKPTDKIIKAKQYNINIITVDTLIKML